MGRQASLAVLPVLGAIVAGAALAVSCGSRTGLLLPGQGGQGGASGSSGSSGGGSTGPLVVPCNAALQAGAPTPTRGFCTTRANQAAVSGPTAPAVAWNVAPFPVPTPENYLPAETVVDASGRIYVAIDASPMAPAGTQSQLVTIDADGSSSSVTPFDAAISQLSLAADGRLWLVETSPAGADCPPECGSSLLALTADGPASGTPIPSLSSFSLMAISSTGDFFLGSPGLARVAPGGAVLWQNSFAEFGSALVVGPVDDVVSADETYDAAGNQLGDGSGADLTAVNAQGNIVGLSVGVGIQDNGPPSLVVSEPSGNQLLDLSLPAPTFNLDAYQLAVAGDGTMIVLLADEATSPGLTKSELQIIAVDAAGEVLWTTPLSVTLPYDPADLTTHYGLFVDAAGTVVLTAGSVMGLSLASGAILWTLAPANPQSCLRPAVLGAGGAIVATQCDGTVFLARDP
jgi:hypothetical protein